MIAFGILALLIITWFNGPGLDRSPAIHRYLSLVIVSIGLVMAYYHDWWILALWTLICANALRFPWPMGQIVKLSTAGVLYLLLKTMQTALTADLIPYILYGIIAVAFAQGILYFAHRRWSGNPNHTDMLMVMGIASALALSLIEHPAFALAVLPLLAPFVTRPKPWRGQAWQWACIAGLASGAIAYPIIAFGAGFVLIGAMGYFSWPYRLTESGPDHGRIRIWTILLRIWWMMGWKVRLIGLGPDSWRSFADRVSRIEQQKTGKPGSGQFFTHPHNEYVHVLFEHGMAGLVLLLGWIGSLLWSAWTMQPALVIPALTLCAIACTCFPWTLPYEVGVVRNNRQEYDPFGCIGMVVVTTLIVAVLS